MEAACVRSQMYFDLWPVNVNIRQGKTRDWDDARSFQRIVRDDARSFQWTVRDYARSFQRGQAPGSDK